VHEAAAARLGNAGQSCVSTMRIIVLNEFYDAVVEGVGAPVQSGPKRRSICSRALDLMFVTGILLTGCACTIELAFATPSVTM
jgi:hypothetical protein